MNKVNLFLTSVFVLFVSGLQAQEVLYASKVNKVSSEYGEILFSGKQALGLPNALPQGGDNPYAWSPKRQSGVHFISVGFEKAIQIQQIAIGECYNPGAVSKVYAIDLSGVEHEVGSFTPKPLKQDSRVLNIYVDKTDFKVVGVKVEIDSDKVPGYNSIDFIAISDSKTPIEVKVNDSKTINPNLNTERLTEKINSPYDEINPIISPDGKRLYFGRKNHPENIGGEKDEEDIWYSDWDEKKGEWGLAKNLGAPLNNKGPNFLCSITPDGQNFIAVLGNVYSDSKKNPMQEGVSISVRTKNGFSQPIPLKIENYVNLAPTANFFMANNRKTIILSIVNDESVGGKDLYVSFKRSDGSWTPPLNLGKQVNSIGNETAPFLAADDKTMFFSSDGLPGYGSDDIYMTKRLDDTWQKWSKPENLGKNINTKESDIFFTLPANGDFAYYSSGGKEANGQLDLFRLRIPDLFKPTPVIEISGKVLDKVSKKPIKAKIIYENLDNNKEVGVLDNDQVTGEYKLILPIGGNYGYLAQADGYLSVHQSLDATKFEEAQKIKQDLVISSIKTGASLSLNNIFFDYNKSNIKSESFGELDRLCAFMKENTKVRIKIGGHTDSQGSDEYNAKLSQSRAESVIAYLEKKGINKSRMEIKALGKSAPLTSDEAKAEGAALNRRVDIEIVE